MADQANLFAQAQEPQAQEPQQPVQQPAPAAPQLAPEVAAYVGEGRKYANVQAALASIPHAQSHIANLEAENQRLKQENETLKADLAKAKNLEDVVASLTVSQQPTASQVQAGLDEQAVLELLNKRDAQAQAQANQVAVTNALIGKFGDSNKATEALKAKAAELGVGFDFMKDLAAKSPKAVLSYFNVESKPTTSTVIPTATQTTAQFQTPPEPQLNFKMGSTGSTSDLVSAFRACGLAVNGGQEVSHAY
ncbi:hypothetical protein [Vibrio phage JSF23]|jgi:hypothetical protein|uniref:Uncharacterized protein n=3 Tax=Icepovirus bengalense TaxID=2846603 RepID=A0A076G4B3_9CAUD|nr:hypothetical protein TU12-16_00080 [Vibrio phage ICP2_2006_A]AII27061.1 hypothetical protein ICP22011A_0017 [Vibrio phage ICP2_2011_A]ASV43784.1 hypothetical protein [Vibrio phage JSF23]ASV43810.1 hypothetical protein [Vibrio phage JSF27]